MHAYPWSELSQAEYEKLFESIEGKLRDSLTATDFYKLVKPTIAFLSDEHAAISLPQDLAMFGQEPAFLPFTLIKTGEIYRIDTVLTTHTPLKKGDQLKAVENVPIEELIRKMANYTSGFPEQRVKKAIRQFGYLYPMTFPQKKRYRITLKSGEEKEIDGVEAKTMFDYFDHANRQKYSCNQKISYRKIQEVGYINACSFSVKNDSDMQVFERDIDQIFKQIKKDKIARLIIDISSNGGGNSAVGNLLIAKIYHKPYQTYQCNWKRSDEYLQLMKSWGSENPQYEDTKVGETLHFSSSTINPPKQKHTFKGKAYVLIGDGTFSSAIMFATIVKDNSIATLIGSTPEDGHPTHFGELYSTKTPKTGLPLRFGVKEWIRPAGKVGENILLPDIAIESSDLEKIIASLPK